MNNLRTLDLIVIAIYFIGVAGIGLWFARRQNSTETYFVARRSIPHWAMGLSMFATIISSITFIAYPGSAYAGNWNELVPGFMVIGVLILAGTFIIPFFRHAVGMSAYEYFEKRFGYGARAYSSMAFIAGHFSKMGFVVYLLALTIHGMTGCNIYALILVSGLVTVVYTLFGGLEAVIWTQVIQGIVKLIGVVVIIGVLLWIMPGGAGAAISLASDHDKFSLGTWNFDPSTTGSILVMSLYGFFFYVQKYTADQTLVQRYLVAKSDREAMKGVALGAIMCIPAWIAFMLVGTLLWAYYQLSGESFPAYLHDPVTGKVMPDKVFPFFLTTKIPVGLAGLFMAALLSAGMSTMASDLNCLSAVVVEDYYRKLWPNSADHQRLSAAKLIVAVCGLLTVGIAALIALKGDRSLGLYYAVSSIVAGGLAGMFLLAFFSRRANRQGLWIGIAAALIFTAWATLTCSKYHILHLNLNFTWPDVMIGVIAHVIVLVVGWSASWLFPADTNVKSEWTYWGWMQKRRLSAKEIISSASAVEVNP